MMIHFFLFDIYRRFSVRGLRQVYVAGVQDERALSSGERDRDLFGREAYRQRVG
jgi:hypothetical protein